MPTLVGQTRPEKRNPYVGLNKLTRTWPMGMNLTDHPSLLGPDQASLLRDFISTRKGLIVPDQYSRLGNAALGNKPLRLAQYKREKLDRFTVAHTKDKFYKYADPAWSDISRAGGYTGTDTDPWDSTVVLNKYVFTNYIDKLQYWDGDTATALDFPATAAGKSLEFVRAKFVVAFAGRLVLLNLKEESPTVTRALRARWSKELNILNDTDWTDTGAGAADLADTPDAISGAAKLGKFLVVYKEQSLYHGIETGDINKPIVFDLRASAGLDKGVGLVSHWTLAELTNFHIGLFNDNVYIYDGTRFTPIGDPIMDDVVRKAGAVNIKRAFATIEPTQNWYILWVPLSGQTFPQYGYVYDYSRGIWVGQINRPASCVSVHTRSTDLTWDNANFTWDSANYSWDSLSAITDFPALIIGDPDSNEVKIADAAVTYVGTALWDTDDIDFGFPDYETSVRRVRLRVEGFGQTGTIGVLASGDGGESYTVGSQKQFVGATAAQDLLFDFLHPAKRHRFRISSTSKVRITQFEATYSVRREIQ